MMYEKTNITISIEFSDKKFGQVVLKSLEPENDQIDDNSTIQMALDNQNLIIEFSSCSSISTIRNTIDDILNTINTSENIYRTVT